MKILPKFLTELGLDEEPMGIFYTDEKPIEGFSPKPNELPTRETFGEPARSGALPIFQPNNLDALEELFGSVSTSLRLKPLSIMFPLAFQTGPMASCIVIPRMS
jgi:hypothetical protein